MWILYYWPIFEPVSFLFPQTLLYYTIIMIFLLGRSHDHFLHARACYMMKQNSPNCLLCPNESFPSKSFYISHMKERHLIEVDSMLCISCGMSSSVFEYIPRHQVKCFQVNFTNFSINIKKGLQTLWKYSYCKSI